MISRLKATFQQDQAWPLALSMLALYIGTSAFQFHSIFVESKGFWGKDLGIFFMLGYLAAGISPALNSFITQKFASPTPPLLFYLLVAGLSLMALPLLDSFFWLSLVYMVHSFSLAAIFPLHLSFGLDICRNLGQEDYYVFRGLGTFGFALGCAVCAFLILWVKFTPLYIILAFFYLFAFVAVYRSYRKVNFKNTLPDHEADYLSKNQRKLEANWKQLFSNRKLMLLLGFLGLLSLANTMVIVVVGNYIKHEFSASNSVVSWAWTISSGFEIPIMLMAWIYFKRLGIRNLVLIGVCATFLRLGLMAFSPNLTLFLVSLSLHGFFYATYASTLGIWVDQITQGNKHATQFLFSLIYAAIPATMGSFLTGYLWERYSLHSVFEFSFGISLVAVVGIYFMRHLLPGKNPI